MIGVSYRWPAEWEAHAGTWLAWPVNRNTWPGIFERIPQSFAKFVAAIARFEPVFLIADSSLQEDVRKLTGEACSEAAAMHPVNLIDVPVNDSWCRDYGPQFLTRRPQADAGKPAQVIVDWDYNAWGKKYPPWDLDAAATTRMSKFISLPVYQPGFVLEGGAIDGNGADVVLTTRSCLLQPDRNGSVDQATVESWLSEWIGASQVIWLPGGGIEGDDTNGHIDQIARFVDECSVVVSVPNEQDTVEAEELRENARVLAASTIGGRSLHLTELKRPGRKIQDGRPLPCSYANFCLCNSGVLCPTFQDPQDDSAMAVLQSLFPDRQVVGVDCLDLAWGLGALHCLSHEQPAPPSAL